MSHKTARPKNADVILYGVNTINTEMAVEYFAANAYHILAFADGNDEFHGKQFYGIMCVGIDDLVREPYSSTPVINLISNINTYRVVSANLDKRGIKYTNIFEFVYEAESSKFAEARLLLDDDLSRQTFDIMAQAKQTFDISPIKTVSQTIGEMGFSFFNEEVSDLVYVDCGAYVGDTVEKYLFHNIGAKKIYAFEPFLRNYNALVKRCNRLAEEWGIDRNDFICVNASVGETSGSLEIIETYGASYCRTSSSSVIGSVASDCNVVSLDNYLDGERVDFIKADIEGYEVKMLKGAVETIRKCKPKLSICIYHTPWCFYLIPLLIKEILPEYKIAIRQHSDKIYDTVCYAWVE
jgi:FkbM family methyltransferase